MIYKGEHLREISFPLGGIGSGSIGLQGNGSLSDFEIFNRPSKGSYNGRTHIAVRVSGNGNSCTKVLQSDHDKELIGRYCNGRYFGFGYGPHGETMSGFSHFKDCEFRGEFPIAELTFSDEAFPGKVLLRAFNPFIPLNADDSSIPAAFFEIVYTNESEKTLTFDAVFSVMNPYAHSDNALVQNGRITGIRMSSRGADPSDKDYGDLTIACEDATVAQRYWYRGLWQDAVSTFWSELSREGKLTDRVYTEDKAGEPWYKDTCSLQKSVTLAKGETARVRFVLAWNVPNAYNYWTPSKLPRHDIGHTAENFDCETPWKNYYATLFADSVASSTYALKHFDRLYERTDAFRRALQAMTADSAVIDAVSANISVLKSSTVKRLSNGEFYGFEGVHEREGSCEGTCQHVYNYAYALCFLFPELERSIRDLEYTYCMDERGATAFRLTLPLGKVDNVALPCLDGQMGCVIKTYREWKISGDDEWLKKTFPLAARALEFAWHEDNPFEWDRNRDGVLEGRQHHTLDMEMFGPSSWLQGFYLAALKAGAEMASYLGEEEKAKTYTELYEKGRAFANEKLFNGRYFIHLLELGDYETVKHFGCEDRYWNEETKEIKYQIGEGSSIDQLTGQWHADLCGLGEIFDEEKVKTALASMYEYNFKPRLRDVSNMWRVFALNDEGGAIMCDYPEGAYKPRIPITYCEECMTGFEYTFACLLIKHGMVDEGLSVVRAIRDRYDGKKRNPYNEIECGSHYVRSMASFALLPTLSGMTYDLARGELGFAPIEARDEYRYFFSLGTAWGSVKMTKTNTCIELEDGALRLSRLTLPQMTSVSRVTVDGKDVPFAREGDAILFEATATKTVEIIA